MKALHDIVTTADGTSHDIGRWSWVLSFTAVIVDALWHAYKDSAPSVGDLAAALGVVAAAHAVALFSKQQTEPK